MTHAHPTASEVIWLLLIVGVYVIAALTHPCPNGSALAPVFAWPPLRCVVLGG